MSNWRRILLSVVVIGVVVVAAAVWFIRGPGPMAFAGGPKVALADYHGANPTGVPASVAQADIIARGAYLTKAADCEACHTSKNGKPYAGGLGINLPFGTLYTTNITPDKETGIGNYSDQDFINALQRGIRHDGARLYPAMPYTSYTFITDADALAIKAYLFSLPPVHAPAPANNRQKFAGALTAGWRAFNITSDKTTGVGGWRDQDLVSYLASGHAEGHGTASGPMGEAVDHSINNITSDDVRDVGA
jgi:hypothetical protein